MTEPTETTAEATTFARQGCVRCGITFYWPKVLDDRARNDARTFWCPGCGGSMVYRETEQDRLQRAKNLLEQRLREEKEEKWRAEQERDHAQARVRGYQGALAKTKKRIAAGACPACHERFPNVAEHVASEHPTFGESSGS